MGRFRDFQDRMAPLFAHGEVDQPIDVQKYLLVASEAGLFGLSRDLPPGLSRVVDHQYPQQGRQFCRLCRAGDLVVPVVECFPAAVGGVP